MKNFSAVGLYSSLCGGLKVYFLFPTDPIYCPSLSSSILVIFKKGIHLTKSVCSEYSNIFEYSNTYRRIYSYSKIFGQKFMSEYIHLFE